MRKTVLMVLAASAVTGCGVFCLDAPEMIAVSPDGRNEIRLWRAPLAFSVVRDGVTVVSKSEIGLVVDGTRLQSCKPCLVRKEKRSGSVKMPVYKKKAIDLAANETVVEFGDWNVRLAARNDGVAYRFETRKPRRIRVEREQATLVIPRDDARCALNYGSSFGCEETLSVSCKASEIETGRDPSRKYVYLPFVYEIGGKHVAVTEADVFDYPIWNLVREEGESGDVALGSVFAKWPTKTVNNSKVDRTAGARRERHWNVSETADYLVETDGTRTFPWRAFVLGDAPTAFCSADIVAALARGQAAYDFAWVKPGKVAWDWWNAWDNKGVSAGCNTATYRRFIDFAAKFGVEYVILDEGWSEKLNIWKFNPNVDVAEIIRYGNEKGVGIILWMAWAQVEGDEARIARHFAKLGAKGFKVDFMDRGDADCERFLWTFADECAKNKMHLDYHGMHRPTGMSRAYPNVLNYEGVHGLEFAKWYKNEYDFVGSDVRQFFLRMTAGPMDYTPGAMDNYPLGKYAGTSSNPGSVGTRCRQMALMALYEAPLQMLCDAPSKYEKNLECFSFMAATPVVWDETIGLGGGPDEFAAVARKAKDGSWYVAAINGGAEREFTFDASFLGAGLWEMESFADAAEADALPTRYVHETGKRVLAGAEFSFRMVPGGGFVVRFSEVSVQ